MVILASSNTPHYTTTFKTLVTQKIIQTFHYIRKYKQKNNINKYINKNQKKKNKQTNDESKTKPQIKQL